MSSLSRVVVTRINNLEKHPNADLLLQGSFDGMPFLVNCNDTKNGDWRAIVPFDLEVPDKEIWPEFIRGERVRPKRLRGIFSMAVALPIPEEDWEEGKDVTEKYGFTKWIPPEERDDEPDGVQLQNGKNGYSCPGPSGVVLPKYDLESLRKYHSEFSEGEPVIITEKLHGENISVVYWDGRLHVRSRNRWIAEGGNKWWDCVKRYCWSWLEINPGLVAQGEKYGNVNKFRYDCRDGEQKIRLFDLYDATKGRYLDRNEFVEKTTYAKMDTVPVLYEGPWLGLDQLKHLAEGKSTLGENIREGFVVQPVCEKLSRKFERVKFKLHGEEFLLKGKK